MFILYFHTGLALFLLVSYLCGWLRFITTCNIGTEDGIQFYNTRHNLRFQLGRVDLDILTFGGSRKLGTTDSVEGCIDGERLCKKAKE
jgi:hypothetical protein